jgi:hypothetical protein
MALSPVVNLLNTAQSGLNSIPEIEIPEVPGTVEEKPSNVHKYEVKMGNIGGMEMDTETEYYLFQNVLEQEHQLVKIVFPAKPNDGEVHIIKIDYSTNSSGVDFVLQANRNQHLVLQGGHTQTYDILQRGQYAHYIFINNRKVWVRIY